MKLRPTAAALVLTLIGTIVLAPAGAAAYPTGPNPFTQIPAAGTGADGSEFVGTLNIQRFDELGDELFAFGTLSGQLTRTVDNVAVPVATVTNLPAAVPLISLSATCETLDLVLGPVPPEPLSFAIAVNPVHLGAAILDPEELAGELACSVAILLDSGTPLRVAGELLNPLLESLG
jgi:hypothetical protein